MSAPLHISGENFDMESFLSEISIVPYMKHNKGDLIERRIKKDGKKIYYSDSGCSFDTTTKDDYIMQDVVDFLKDNYNDLKKLQNYQTDDVKIDFMINLDTKDSCGTWVTRGVELPLELTKLSSELGIYILLTYYNPDLFE
jgi:hypothetical protein